MADWLRRLTIKIKLAGDVEYFRYAIKTRGKTLNETTIESHARLDEIQVEFLSLSAFHVFLLAIALTESGQVGPEL